MVFVEGTGKVVGSGCEECAEGTVASSSIGEADLFIVPDCRGN